MIAYKLVRKLKNGDYAPLFINKKSRIPIGKWLDAEEHITKGFAIRKGWHCTSQPQAPHLSKKDRVWLIVKVKDTDIFKRPNSQGGEWLIAQKMKALSELSSF